MMSTCSSLFLAMRFVGRTCELTIDTQVDHVFEGGCFVWCDSLSTRSSPCNYLKVDEMDMNWMAPSYDPSQY